MLKTSGVEFSKVSRRSNSCSNKSLEIEKKLGCKREALEKTCTNNLPA